MLTVPPMLVGLSSTSKIHTPSRHGFEKSLFPDVLQQRDARTAVNNGMSILETAGVDPSRKTLRGALLFYRGRRSIKSPKKVRLYLKIRLDVLQLSVGQLLSCVKDRTYIVSGGYPSQKQGFLYGFEVRTRQLLKCLGGSKKWIGLGLAVDPEPIWSLR